MNVFKIPVTFVSLRWRHAKTNDPYKNKMLCMQVKTSSISVVVFKNTCDLLHQLRQLNT